MNINDDSKEYATIVKKAMNIALKWDDAYDVDMAKWECEYSINYLILKYPKEFDLVDASNYQKRRDQIQSLAKLVAIFTDIGS